MIQVTKKKNEHKDLEIDITEFQPTIQHNI